MKPSDRDVIIWAFKTQFIDYDKQKQDNPNHVANNYIHWLYYRWNMGLISLSEYKALVVMDVLEV